MTVLVLLPFCWLIKTAGPDYLKGIDNLFHAQDGIVLTWLRNSAITTLGALLLSVISSITAGFVLAVLEIPFRKTMLVITLITMLIPITAMAMPLYVMIDKIHLNDNIFGLIIASAYYPFGAFLSYLYFSSALPGDVVGMGRIDGLGDWGIFYHLGIPLSKSLWSIVTFFSFISLWNSYELPKVLLNDPKHSTLPMGLELLFGQGTALVGVLMLIPPVLLYLMSQRSIERGIFSGAVKG
ncbi:MAG: carbohydrate ABC transporter permease [Actinomycetota bacterium]